MNSADELARSYDWCYRVARRSGSSFYRAIWLLEKPQRNAMFALYAFARITDDLGDAPGDLLQHARRHAASDLNTRTERLRAWQARLTHRASAPAQAASLHLLALGETSDAVAFLAQYDQLWPALRHAVKTYQLPVELLQDLVTGVTMDLQPVRLQHWSDVDRYCYHVASTVGLACTKLWRAAESMPVQEAIDCGVAFQITNILRDLKEDAARNRIYLPLDELRKFGCDTESWLSGAPRGDWPELVSAVIERARALYANGARTIDHLPSRGARMFALMWSSYRELLEAIDAQKADLWSARRVRVSRRQRVRLLWKAFVTPATSERLWLDR